MNKGMVKTIILVIAKFTGIFAICRRITRSQLRILAFHGAALEDEASFRGGLFMTASRFEERLGFLKNKGYPVLPLHDAVDKLQRNQLPPHATVITIDDGWYGTACVMAPLLKKYEFPSTLYVASYYLQKQTQVFNVVVDYILWKSEQETIDLAAVRKHLTGQYKLSDEQQRTAATQALWRYADALASSEERQKLLEDVGFAVGVSLQDIVDKRLFSYMTADEAAEMARFGMDLQLHTHRHRFHQQDRDSITRELADNAAVLQQLSAGPFEHFCYPSGEYDPEQVEWLADAGIRSATTTTLGFNTPNTPVLELCRFMDAEEIGMLEYEAEMAGFFEVIRWIKSARSGTNR